VAENDTRSPRIGCPISTLHGRIDEVDARLERLLREIFRTGNDAMRFALRESNEALVAPGHASAVWPDVPGA
jgi:hypothetical protein